jgi:hypothetical protein
MGLGSDHATAATEFVEAMRPIAGDNVDLAPVQANLGALGLAVYRTLTVDAETVADGTSDAAFWQWVAAVQAWMTAVTQAIAAWVPATAPELALKAALTAVPGPGAPPNSAPTSVTGRIS